MQLELDAKHPALHDSARLLVVMTSTYNLSIPKPNRSPKTHYRQKSGEKLAIYTDAY